MDYSRKVRRQQKHQLFFKQAFNITIGMVLTFILGINLFFGNVLTFTILSITMFFGILFINPYNVKKFVPGLACSSIGIRSMATLLYLLAVFALISRVSSYYHG